MDPEEVFLLLFGIGFAIVYFHGPCLHEWGKWKRRVVREPFCLAETRQLRSCIKCGKVQDKFMHYGEWDSYAGLRFDS